MNPEIKLLSSSRWVDYELLDSGNGLKLERFGPYTFVRPEHQAVWSKTLSDEEWKAAHADFQPTGSEEMGGKWRFRKLVEPSWKMRYGSLRFRAQISSSRHLGVFPEQAAHWDWMQEVIPPVEYTVNVLNLFGYTGLASLAAAAAGAKVTHIDASKKSVSWARENQALSGLNERSIRWIIEDSLKYVQRAARRGSQYDGIILDPPKFGRGPKGEVWECFEMLPTLLEACRAILSPKPLFVILTAYAIRASALSLYYALSQMSVGLSGEVTTGELVTHEKSAGRMLSQAIWARWESVK